MPVILPAGCSLIALDQVDSTNDEAKRRAAHGAADGTVVWARSQSAGRGRRGRRWISPTGNLYASIILRQDKSPAQTAQLSLAAAEALAEALEALLPDGVLVQCKWPNDVLVEGRKIAGILLESSGAAAIDWVVVGCGVNIASHPQLAGYPTTCLAEAGAGGVTVAGVLEAFVGRLMAWRARWMVAGIEPLRAAWIARAAKLGETIIVRLPNREISGRFVDLDRHGALLLELPGGARETISAGDVFFL
jgi:BirA family biotin operon repressor/biotin-[acetyl-CoA-carboxylase] ligase